MRKIPIAFLTALVALSGCKSAPPTPEPPKPPVVKLNLAIGADANPDTQNRPSPVVVRVYQLKDDAAFKGADFFALFDKEQATLAASLISREEFEVAPGEQRSMDYQVSLDARFVGVVAAYRDIRNAAWRAEAGSQDKGLAEGLARSGKIGISVGRARVAMTIE